MPGDLSGLEELEIKALTYCLPDFLNLGKKSSNKHFEIDSD
jgi:hypothetical protein